MLPQTIPLDVVNLYRVFKGGDVIHPDRFYKTFCEEIENGLLNEEMFDLMVIEEWKVVQDKCWRTFKSLIAS